MKLPPELLESRREKPPPPPLDSIPHPTPKRFMVVFCVLRKQSPEAVERRKEEAAAELQRQQEQEEWDRAFEEELIQTGLPEDVVAACVYQILAVSWLGVGGGRGRRGI